LDKTVVTLLYRNSNNRFIIHNALKCNAQATKLARPSSLTKKNAVGYDIMH